MLFIHVACLLAAFGGSLVTHEFVWAVIVHPQLRDYLLAATPHPLGIMLPIRHHIAGPSSRHLATHT